MKLLELLVQEELQWPTGAKWAVQDGDGELKFNDSHTAPYIANHFMGWWINPSTHGARFIRRRYMGCALSDDWATKAVSKQEYDAAMVAAGYMCPGDASCTDQGCPHHYASDVVEESGPAHARVRDWYAELAPIITAAAAGKVAQYLAADDNWYTITGVFVYPNKYRVKPEEPKTIKVNGFDVPEPMREAPADYTQYFSADTTELDYYYENSWVATPLETRWLLRGLLHSTKEAAVAHAKAMLGIDPYADEDADDEHA